METRIFAASICASLSSAGGVSQQKRWMKDEAQLEAAVCVGLSDLHEA